MNEKDVNEFPQKVDKILDYVNNVYFDGQVDIHNREWAKAFAKKNKGKLAMD